MGQRGGDDGAEIVEQSGRYALIRDADGIAIFDLDLGSDVDPVASYPPGDEGFEAAWERYGRLVRDARRERFGLVRVLGIVVVAGVIVWVVAGIGYGSSHRGGRSHRQRTSEPMVGVVPGGRHGVVPRVARSPRRARGALALAAVRERGRWRYRASAPGRGRSWIGPGRSLRNPPLRPRRTATISAMIDPAISSGPSLPRSSPAGPWMLARSSGVIVAPSSARSIRSRCVRAAGPSMPM